MKNNQNSVKSFLRSTSALLLTDAVSMILMVLFSIALARIVGEETFGLFSIMIVLSMVLRSLAEAGFDIQIPRVIAANKQDAVNFIIKSQRFKNTIWLYSLPIGLVVGIIQDVLLIVVILMIYNLAFIQFSTYKGFLRGIQRMDLIARIETGFNIIQYILLFAILFTFESLYLMFCIFAIVEFMKVVYCNKVIRINFIEIPKVPKLLFDIDFKIRKQEISDQSKLLGVTFFSVIQFRSPMLVLWGIGSASQLGVYSAAQRFLTMLRVIPGAIINALVPEASLLRSNKADNKFINVYSAIFVIGVLISGALYFASDILMELTFGFENASPVLAILSLSFIFVMLNSTTEAYLLAWEKENIVNLILTSAGVFAIVLSFVLYYRNGLEGVASAVVIAEIFMFILNMIALNKYKTHSSTLVD